VSRVSTILTAVVLVLASAGLAEADSANVGTKLNLRSGPGPAFGVIAVMPPGAKVVLQKCYDDWCRVKFGRQVGYTSRAYLNFGSAADSYASAAPPPPPQQDSTPTSTGPRIWRWRDSEWRDRHWRLFGWQNRLSNR
jgi:uncharacterized protein YraI